MNLFQPIRFALVSLAGNKIRTGLTTLGVVIGVFAVVALTGLGEGVRNQFADLIQGIGTNLVIVVPGNLEGGFPAGSIGTSALTLEDAERIEDVDNVEGVTAATAVTGVFRAGAQSSSQDIVLGTNEQIFSITDLEIVDGRGFDALDVEEATRVIVLGRNTADRLFPDGGAVGAEVDFRGVQFEVIGIIEDDSEGFSFGPTTNDSAYLPITTAEEVAGALNIIRIMVKIDEPDAVEGAVAEIDAELTDAHGGSSDDFSVITQEDALELFDTFFGILTAAVSGIAAISLVVGGIGIMNIMLVAVTERTREIGIRKAIGAKSRHILGQFLTEAALISLVGGGIGLGLAWIMMLVLNAEGTVPMEITLTGVGLAMGISVAVGIVFGLAPAIKASRARPIEAIRYE